jgi:hypothetical protein
MRRTARPVERVLVHALSWTYVYYLFGALYVLGPAMGWLLILAVARRTGLRDVPPAAWCWAAGMGLMMVPLIAAHADFDLGLGPMIKSSIGWAKGWALIAIYIILGCSGVRLNALARAANLLGIQTLCLLPLLVLAWAARLPGDLYVSPLQVVGGPGPEYFTVQLYGISPDSGAPRWRLFAPWAPAIGMVMGVLLPIGWNDPDRRRRLLGAAGMVLAILLSGSRLALLALPIALAIAWAVHAVRRPSFWFAAAPITLALPLAAETLQVWAEAAVDRFHGARADSSRVRAALGRIAVDRWQQDAFWFGHGNVERGPHLVEYMPIGSHHSWFGLLFVKGVIGFVALIVPMLCTLVVLVRGASHDPRVRTALTLVLLLGLYTLAENIEILAYLIWPGLVAIGIGLRACADAARRTCAAGSIPSAVHPQSNAV